MGLLNNIYSFKETSETRLNQQSFLVHVLLNSNTLRNISNSPHLDLRIHLLIFISIYTQRKDTNEKVKPVSEHSNPSIEGPHAHIQH